MENGKWQIRNQGYTDTLIKKYKDAIERIHLDTEKEKEEENILIPTAKINSSMEAEKSTEIEDIERSQIRKRPDSPEIMWDNQTFGKAISTNEEDHQNEEEFKEATEPRRSMRKEKRQHPELLSLGARIVMNVRLPELKKLENIMAKKTEQSIGEYQKRNPTEKEAKNGPNREK